MDINGVFALQHQSSNLQKLKDAGARQRIIKIKSISRYLLSHENRNSLTQALYIDLHKPAEETLTNELAPVHLAITHAIHHVRNWMRDEPVGNPLSLLGTKSFIRYEPKGHVLIISPWNYPFQLTIIPFILAIAAGNAIIIKPSEHAPAMADWISKMVSSLFHESEVTVINGDQSVATELLKKPFHHIYFTGSTSIGKAVMAAAAKNLASVTLELGGKSPVIIDESYPVTLAAEKIAWAKTMNSGQTCIAPDYVLIHESMRDEFVNKYVEALHRFYGKNLSHSALMARMINPANFQRAKKLLDDALGKGAVVLAGGNTSLEDLYVEPTLLGNVNSGMLIMQEEIFSPLLPVITYSKLQEAIDTVNTFPKALVLYILSNHSKRTNRLLQQTSAGGTVINELMISTVNPDLPFGGVNESGIGKSNGRYGFLEFSNARGVMKRRWGTMRMLWPPYNKKIVELLLRITRL